MNKWHIPAIATIVFLLVVSQHVAVAQSVTAEQNKGDVLRIRDNAPKEYVVKKGDTLWDISEMYLNDPWYWPELWRINEKIANPHLIYPGDKLYLVWIDGKPQLTRKAHHVLLPEGTVQNKPVPVPMFSREMLEPLLIEHRLLTLEQRKLLPKVLGDNRGAPRINGLLPIFIQGEVKPDKYSVYTPVARIEQGHLYRLVADVNVTSRHGDLWEGEPQRIQREISRGDIVLPRQSSTLPDFISPKSGVETDGRLVAALNSRKQQGKYDVVVLDKGKQQGVEVGHMFKAVRPGSTIFVEGESITLVNRYKPSDDLSAAWRSTEQLPMHATAELMVLEVQENTSYALVLRSRDWLQVGDYFVPLAM